MRNMEINIIENIKNSKVCEKKTFARHLLEILKAAQNGIRADYDSLVGYVKFALKDLFDISQYTAGVFLLKTAGVLKIHPDTRDARRSVFEQLQNYVSS